MIIYHFYVVKLMHRNSAVNTDSSYPMNPYAICDALHSSFGKSSLTRTLTGEKKVSALQKET